MRGLVEFFIVVDAENRSALSDGHAKSAHLRRKITRGNAGHHEQGCKSVKVRHAGAQGKAWNLGVVPHNREGDGRIPQDAEVVCAVRVLPKVFAINDQVLSKCLLQPGMELISESRWRICRHAWNQSRDYVHVAARGRHDQVFIERRFQCPRVRDPQHGIGRLDVVRDSEPWLDFAH